MGEVIRTGFQIAENDGKTKKKHSPNIHTRTYFSKILGKHIKVHVSAKAMQ
jgi:ribosomal protein L28